MMVSMLSLYRALSWLCACSTQAGRDLTASDGRHKTLQVQDLPDICRLVDQAAHMDGKPSTIYIIRPLTQAVKQNGIDQTDQNAKVPSVSLIIRKRAVRSSPSISRSSSSYMVISLTSLMSKEPVWKHRK